MMETKDFWVCKNCFKLYIGEWECFTDVNWLEKICPLCEENVGEHHVTNLLHALTNRIRRLLSDGYKQ